MASENYTGRSADMFSAASTFGREAGSAGVVVRRGYAPNAAISSGGRFDSPALSVGTNYAPSVAIPQVNAAAVDMYRGMSKAKNERPSYNIRPTGNEVALAPSGELRI